jgi:hypothetical protein
VLHHRLSHIACIRPASVWLYEEVRRGHLLGGGRWRLAWRKINSRRNKTGLTRQGKCAVLMLGLWPPKSK